MDVLKATSAKLLFLGTAGIGLAIFLNHLYKAMKKTRIVTDDGEKEQVSNENSFVTLATEDDGLWSSSSQYFHFNNQMPCSLSWTGSVVADFSLVYVVLLNTQDKLSHQEYKNAFKKVCKASQKKLQVRDPVLLKKWQEDKRYHVIQVIGDGDLHSLYDIAETRGVLKILLNEKGTSKGLALGLGPAKAIDVKIVLYENLVPPEIPAEKNVLA